MTDTQLKVRRGLFDDVDICANRDCRSFMGIIENQPQVTCTECGAVYCEVCWEGMGGKVWTVRGVRYVIPGCCDGS